MHSLSAIPKTLLIPLWARGHATINDIESCKDTFAAKLVLDDSIDFSDLDKMSLSFQSMMFHGVATRTRLFDKAVEEFINKHEYPLIINLGCGLDYRSYRLGDHNVSWYNIDVRDSHLLRKELLEARENIREIEGGIDDSSWFDKVKVHPEQSILLISEGTFMYFEEKVIKKFFDAFINRFPEHEACIEVIGDLLKDKVHPSVKAVGSDSPFKHGFRDTRAFFESNVPTAHISNIENLYKADSRLPWWLKTLFYIKPELKFRLGSILVSYRHT